ncbi:peptidyl-prolyl cis-trans isomerase, FKBP-type domain [Klebsiella quasipneumoniae]|nr:peptidylprolyl isomerase [Klebsiella quasipneumoniae]VGM15920.1 peptidyl-prolyl cis-trans isomerase, FKBP-type domain [Klebsiella pneumoniae]VGP91519.1 FKBP-type peptidyl-prolyl cis-trans isomerase FkpA [Klebsiella quasipneumoniae subsp. quasipneumoniae]MBZ7055192.1 peptidylprolyl isomerase [Klebsiella quasipneumoniae]SAU87553.1 peptidyl-prolyl cis-trans isomerase%2C FKBP-type domain [Klebsiella quasipneumoniae]
MNRAATLTLNAPLLMLVAALALSTPFFAGAAPAFLDYAQQQTQAHEKSDAATAKQTSGDRQPADNKKKTPNTAQLQKRIVSQQATIEQKNKTIQQLKKQLANTPATETSIANEQAALNNKIKELQIALTAATAKNEALIKKEGAVQNTTLQQSQAAALKQIQQLTSQLQQAAAENKRLSASLTALKTDKQTLANRLAAAEKAQQTTLDQVKTLNADKQPLVNRLAATEKEKQTALDQVKTLNADKQSLANRLAATEKEKQTALDQIKALNADKQPLVNRLAAAEKEKQTALDQIKALNTDKQPLVNRLAAAEKEKQTALDQIKALNADKQSLANRLAAAEKAPSSRADAAVAAKDEPPEMAAIVAAYRLQADKDNAQLRMKEDEIQLLRTQLTVPPRNTTGKTAAKLSAPGEQQAYAIGASMGTEALNVLTTRRTQGVNVDAGLVLQGIEDAFSGQLRLGEQERNKALFDISQQVFQNLNKIEQKNISAGQKYQQAFARKKGVVFKEGVYSRIDYPGKGKISGNDLVTVVIKEMLTDGTVINDMETKDQALTQKLDAYPPVFRGPLKRLQNHGSVTLVVPPDKAYGSKGLPPKIPPGATMVYSVRIVDSQPAPVK